MISTVADFVSVLSVADYFNKGGDIMNNVTVREFTSRMWYVQPMVIIPWRKLNNEPDLEEIKKRAIYVGTPHELRSDNYANINNRYVDGYGAIDGTMVITVHGD